MRKLFIGLFAILALALPREATAGVTCTIPFNLVNGVTADATQVMANYNAILSCLATGTAKSGANNDITSLSGLTTALPLPQGGTPAIGFAAPCSATGLKITNNAGTPDTKIDVTSDDVTMLSSNLSIYRTGVSITIDTTTVGANGMDAGVLVASTWTYVYLIDNGTTVAGLASLSATAPTMPGGYSYKCRLGAMLPDAMTKFFRTLQLGSHAVYVPTVGSNTTTLPAIAAANTGGVLLVPTQGVFTPVTATRVSVWVTCTSNQAAALCYVAPSTVYTTARGLYLNQMTSSGTGTTTINGVVDIQFEVNTIEVFSNTAQFIAGAYGWDDKVHAR